MTFALKINKLPEFYMTFARKMPEFYVIARKIFFPEFWGHVSPKSPTPMDPAGACLESMSKIRPGLDCRQSSMLQVMCGRVCIMSADWLRFRAATIPDLAHCVPCSG